MSTFFTALGILTVFVKKTPGLKDKKCLIYFNCLRLRNRFGACRITIGPARLLANTAIMRTELLSIRGWISINVSRVRSLHVKVRIKHVSSSQRVHDELFSRPISHVTPLAAIDKNISRWLHDFNEITKATKTWKLVTDLCPCFHSWDSFLIPYTVLFWGYDAVFRVDGYRRWIGKQMLLLQGRSHFLWNLAIEPITQPHVRDEFGWNIYRSKNLILFSRLLI